MVDVSKLFTEKICETSRYVQLRGSLNNKGEVTTLEEADFVSGSVSRVSKAVGGTNFRIGDTHIDYLNFSLGIRNNQFNNLIGSTVVLEYGLEVSDGVVEWCKLGTFIINQSGVTRMNKIVKVTADSMLSKADNQLTEVTSGKPYDIASWVCSKCGLELKNTSDDFELFANGTKEVSMPDPNVYDGIKTYRDLLMWLANWTCTFVTCDVDGKIVFKPYVGVSVFKINPDTVSSKEFGDYTTNVTNVTMSVQDKTYDLDPDASLDNTLVLDENPLFINYIADELRIDSLTNIRDELNKMHFTPFKIEFNGNPAIEVGDWVTYSGSDYLVTSSNFKYKGKCTIQGVGLKTGNTKKQSSTTRGSSGGSGGGGSSVQYSTIRYVNVKEIAIQTSKTKLFDLAFELGANVVPIVTVLITCNITSEGALEVNLNYDNANIIPIVCSYAHLGKHTISFTFPLSPRDVSMTHTLFGYIKSTGSAEGTIDVENVLISVSAWGITSGTIEWDGRFDINEEVPTFDIVAFNDIAMEGVSENVQVYDYVIPNYGNNVSIPVLDTGLGGMNLVGISESVNFTHYVAPTIRTLTYTATEAERRGNCVLRGNSYAPDGYDLDYIGDYKTNGAVWTFDLASATSIDLSVFAASGDTRLLDVYVDDVLVSDNLEVYTSSYESGKSFDVVSNYSLSAGTHNIGVGKDTGSYAPLVQYITIKYEEVE